MYVWNQWVFRHEILTEHRIPLRTGRILTVNGLTDPVTSVTLSNLPEDPAAFALAPAWMKVRVTVRDPLNVGAGGQQARLSQTVGLFQAQPLIIVQVQIFSAHSTDLSASRTFNLCLL